MRALTLRGAGNLVLDEVPEPVPEDGDLLVEAVALGVCGTDREIVARGPRPEASTGFVVGHESLGRVLHAPAGSELATGDLVVGIVRRPDPEPCPHCARGEADLCANGRYTERGIVGLDGFGSERFRLEREYAVRVEPALGLAGVLVEPASVVAKAWERVDRVADPDHRRVLVLGAGPIGLLAALLGVQRGLEVHVVDQVDAGAKPRRVAELGAVYHSSVRDLVGTFDAVLECCGALVGEAIAHTAAGGVACVVGVGDPRSAGSMNVAELSHELVAGNKVLMGTVNSNRRHFEAAHAALRQADARWLAGLLTDRVPLTGWRSAFGTDPQAIKAVIEFAA